MIKCPSDGCSWTGELRNKEVKTQNNNYIQSVKPPLPTCKTQKIWYRFLTALRNYEMCQGFYCETQKTVNTWKFSGMLIVYSPITVKFRTREQTAKPQTNYLCCLRFSYLAPYWLISRNTITFRKNFWCSQFCEFHSNKYFVKIENFYALNFSVRRVLITINKLKILRLWA